MLKLHQQPTELRRKANRATGAFSGSGNLRKTVQLTPELKTQYETEVPVGRSVYDVALADVLKAPSIKEVDVNNYTGLPGSTIRIRATDDFKVKDVAVEISNSDGTLVENGNAVASANGLDWIFTATAANASLAGDKIIIRVSDIPGNLKEQVLNL